MFEKPLAGWSLPKSEISNDRRLELRDPFTDYYSSPVSQERARSFLISILRVNNQTADLFYDCALYLYKNKERDSRGHRNIRKFHADLYLPKFGLIIEVDGDVHDREVKMKMDTTTEADIYNALGLHVLRYPSRWFYSSRGRIRIGQELSKYVKSPLSKSDRDRIKNN
ncbi:MAG: hypothetical protein IPK68_04125 [Bdellovibrionales bacterium]|nr:hypothetical protein [Bdellovibrionales bacterium]